MRPIAVLVLTLGALAATLAACGADDPTEERAATATDPVGPTTQPATGRDAGDDPATDRATDRATEPATEPATDPTGPTRPPAGGDPRLATVETWAFALGVDLDDHATRRWLAGFDLVVVDGEVDDGLVADLHDGGTTVLAYLSVGTIEPDRPWSDRLAPFRLDLWEDWGEWYADVDDPDLRQAVLEEVVPPILSTGVDGLFLDNLDALDAHPEQRDGMVALVGELRTRVDELDGLLFAQNGEDVLGDELLDRLDGWNREDLSWTPDGDGGYRAVPVDEVAAGVAAVERMRDRGLFVTVTDYVPEGDEDAVAGAAETACAAGALPYAADRDLTRRPEPRRCP